MINNNLVKVTQILSLNSLKPTSEHLLCSVRTRLRLANAFNGSGLQDLTMYPVRSLQGTTHAIQNQRIFPPSISQNGISFSLSVTKFLRRNIISISPTLILRLTMHRKGMNGDLGMWISSMLAWLFWVPFPVMTQFLLPVSTTQLFHNLPRYHPLAENRNSEI